MRVDVSPECYYLLGVSITLTGLVRISKTRYLCKYLSFRNLLRTNLVPYTET